MKDNKLDNIDKLAKKALEDFEVPFEPMDWAAFQHQLKAEDAIDQVAKDALKDHQVERPAHAWKEFEQLLHQQRQNYRYIWWFKMAEMGAMALLVLGLVQWLPCTDHASSIAQDPTANPALLAPNGVDPSNSTAGQATATTAPSTVVTTPGQAAESAKAQQPFTHPIEIGGGDQQPPLPPATDEATANAAAPGPLAQGPLNGAASHTASAKNAASQQGNAAYDEGATTSTVVTNTATDDTKGTGSLDHENLTPALATLPTQEAEETSAAPNGPSFMEKEAATNLRTMAISPILLADCALSTPTDPVVEIKKMVLKAPFKRQQYVSAVLGAGANLRNSMGNTSIGYSAGLTYEWELSERWSIKTGLIANLKRYDRNDVVQLQANDGITYQANQLKTTNLTVVEVPIDVQYTVFKADKWRLYLASGVSLNAVGSRIYTGNQEFTANNLTIRADLNSADFERGLFEGAAVERNAFISFGGGVGIERQLGDALSLYLLPTYRHALNAAGDDYIHTFNVNIGIKAPIVSKKK